jgi:Permease for cytosine/purines, uracil, thiamine, allantoin
MLRRSIEAPSFRMSLVQYTVNRSSLATHYMPEFNVLLVDMVLNNEALKEYRKMREPTNTPGRLEQWYVSGALLLRIGTDRLQWLAANMNVSTFALGALAVPVFGLGFVDALLTIFFINLLGVLPVCFFCTFGPKFGLRQIILSRFFFGYYGVKLSEQRLPLI